jgi:hypothetical protein
MVAWENGKGIGDVVIERERVGAGVCGVCGVGDNRATRGAAGCG